MRIGKRFTFKQQCRYYSHTLVKQSPSRLHRIEAWEVAQFGVTNDKKAIVKEIKRTKG